MRADISDHLIHWTKGECEWDAFYTLFKIIQDGEIKSSSNMIKGSFNVICFTEAPEIEFHKKKSRYSSFGIRVSKKWIYHKGGRPVIYQPTSEYSLLPDFLKWRHVSYDLLSEPVIDFSWEREWRISSDKLSFSPHEITIIIPNDYWIEQFYSAHTEWENYKLVMEKTTYGDWEYITETKPFNYKFSSLSI